MNLGFDTQKESATPKKKISLTIKKKTAEVKIVHSEN